MAVNSAPMETIASGADLGHISQELAVSYVERGVSNAMIWVAYNALVAILMRMPTVFAKKMRIYAQSAVKNAIQIQVLVKSVSLDFH